MPEASELPGSPAAERNKGPIRDVLTARLPAEGHLLEIASGLGQHAVHIAAALPGWSWQPSEPDPEARATLAARVAGAGLPQLRAPIALDVTQPDWGVAVPDAVLCANLIHIAPWSVTEALMQGAGHWLRPGGSLFLYGPFRMGGAHTADSNARFDADLRARDPSWGIRDLEVVTDAAGVAGLASSEVIPMPANNHVVVFRKPV
jgi:SAM-dependent methyltransferase